MDYEKAYKHALDLAKQVHDTTISKQQKENIEIIFPELAESEDEKIIKFLKKCVQQPMGTNFLGDINKADVLAWLEKQSEPADKGEISDGYHTFNELYYYRMLYNAAFFNMLPKEWVHKSKKHHDGEECFGGGWFIVMANLPTGQISNHYELKDWHLFQIPEKEVADKWDGHTPQEAADRLHKYLLEKQGEQKSYGQRKECLDCQFNYAGECKGSCQMKRSERKPTAWSKEDERIRKDLIGFFKDEAFLCHKREDIIAWLEKQDSTWSEEDEKMLNTIIADVSRTLHSCGIGTDEHTIRIKAIDFLKSLRLQSNMNN